MGRDVAQVISRWFPPPLPGLEPGSGHVGFLVDKVLRFPLPIFIRLITPQSPSSVIWDWYNSPVVAAVPNGLSLTPLRIIVTEIIETTSLSETV
jgi:hypothetical protein